MEEFKVRLLEERDQLSEKLIKLDNFIDSEKFDSIDQIQQSLMFDQLDHMESYLYCLNERIRLLGIE